MIELTPEEIAWCHKQARIEVGLEPDPPKGWCRIISPVTGDVAVVTEESWKLLWRRKGWLRR